MWLHPHLPIPRNILLRSFTPARALFISLGVSVAALIASQPAYSADSQGIGQRYDDGLDSRHSATSFINAAKSVGYTGSAWTAGRSAASAWTDTRGAAVVGYFGHANAGVFQVDEGATDSTDQFIGAGLETDVASTDSRFRWWGEYLPFTDVDDVRLAVMAGCYTANADPGFGQFAGIGPRKGIDSVVGFTGLVYFPAACTSFTYSGNYFWERFALHAKAGNTVAIALSKARTDLVAKEGDAGGWGAYRVGGSVASPGSVRLTPAGAGTGLTSRPLGIDPYSVSSLTVTSSTTGTSPMGSTQEFETAEGVAFRRFAANGELIDATAPASTIGEVTLNLTEAQAVARAFVENESNDISGWKSTDSRTTSHSDGESLAAFEWRPLVHGVPGAEMIAVEIDRRTGAVTYFSHAWADPQTDEFAVTADQARAIVGDLVDTTDARVTATADVWNRPRWTVTVDRGIDGLVPDIDRVVVDGHTGDILANTTA